MAWTAPRTWTDGELVTAAIMNPHIRDNQLAEGPHLIVRKTSDQSVTSSTVLISDTALLFPVGTTEVWKFQLHLRYTAATAGDFKVSFQIPASGRVDAVVPGHNSSDAPEMGYLAVTTSDTPTVTLSGATEIRTAIMDGTYIGGGTAGNVTLRWAQGTSSGTATTVLTHSTLWAVKLA